jgi:hypothetical protein
MTTAAQLRAKLNLPMVIGLAMVAGGLLTAYVLAAAVYDAMPALDFPDSRHGDLVNRFVIYLFAVAFQASGPVLLHVFGLSVTAVGAVTALIGLVQAVIQWFRRRAADRA